MASISPTMASRTPMPDGYIKASEVAQILGTSTDRIYVLAREGRLPGELCGDFWCTGHNGPYQVKRCWERVKIAPLAGCKLYELPVISKQREIKPPNSADANATGIPAGFVKASEAAKMVGCTINTLVCKSETGQLPCYRWHKYINERGVPCTVKIWCVNELKKYATATKSKKKKVLPGHLQALLARLNHHAKGGVMDGNGTDIVFGNPARPADWQRIEALAKVGAMDWTLDNWDRLVITLNADWRVDEGTWRAF